MYSAYDAKDYAKTVEYMKPLLASGNNEAVFPAASMILASIFTQKENEDWGQAYIYYKKAAKLVILNL